MKRQEKECKDVSILVCGGRCGEDSLFHDLQGKNVSVRKDRTFKYTLFQEDYGEN